jgi:hypothetical protein
MPSMKSWLVALLGSLAVLAATPALADGCKDEVKEVREDLDKNRDEYSADARAEAQRHLVQAEVPSLKLADCRREVEKAKKALRDGKKK